MNEEEKLLLSEAEKVILLNKDIPGGMDIINEYMNKVYKYFKNVITTASFSDERLIEIFRLERLLENKFLPINSEPIFDLENQPILPETVTNESDCESLMRYIVYQTRLIINKYDNIKTATLEKYCINSSSYVSTICEKLKITQRSFWCSENLSHGTFHCFNIITINLSNGIVKNYLIDCTYRQFFTYAESFLERTGLPLNCGANIGKFMMLDESRKQMAEELLTKGYIELTPENIKHYFDGFVFTGRNGLYYEQLGKKSIGKEDYEPEYTFEDYLEALNRGGLKKEPYIGRQMSILNTQIDFDNIHTNKNKKI